MSMSMSMSNQLPQPPPQPPPSTPAGGSCLSLNPYETPEAIAHRCNYQELLNIIPLDQWILYDDYLQVWKDIWKFIEKKRRTMSVYIRNFGYDYMSTKEFYFSWEQKSNIKDGKLIKYCRFDYLDINHEDTRRLARKKED